MADAREEMSGGRREQIIVEALSGEGGQRSLFQVILGVVDDRDPTPPPMDRIVLVNPVTQGMVVLQGNPAVVAEFLSERGLGGGGPPPASKASIEAMRKVDVDGGDVVECPVCLEGLGGGGGGGGGEGAATAVSEMPCGHRFHEGCIVKWLGMNGSCPVCRFQMPAEEDGGSKKGDEEEEHEEARRGRRRSGLWLTIVYSRRSAGTDRPSSASVEGEDGSGAEDGGGEDEQADQ